MCYIIFIMSIFLSFTAQAVSIYTPISCGELLDKLSILALKQQYIIDQQKLVYINQEYKALLVLAEPLLQNDAIIEWYQKLTSINDQLWHIETNKRKCEQNGIVHVINKLITSQELTTEEHDMVINFLMLARKVYLLNDERASIKYTINQITQSDIVETKSHLPI